MNYWFLYNLSDGSVHGAPYLGPAYEWSNIPEDCSVLGPIEEEKATDIIKDAYVNPLKYKVVNNEIVINSAYVELIPIPQAPSDKDRLAAVENAIAALMGV